jgi:hypothetical protein
MAQLLRNYFDPKSINDTAATKHFSMAFYMGFRYFLQPGLYCFDHRSDPSPAAQNRDNAFFVSGRQYAGAKNISSQKERQTSKKSERKFQMSETAQQYTQRILANAEGQDPVKLQSATNKKLTRLVKGVSTAKLRKRPAPDKWSVAEILAHLADVEIVIGWRMRSILGAPGTPVQAYDQNAWVIAGHYEKRDPRESLELHRAVREANLALLKTLSPDQWKLYGQHSERGQESVEHIVRMVAGHDVNHLQQVERILGSK